MIPMILGLGIVVTTKSLGTDTINDLAFKKLSTLVGGEWTGALGKMTVKFTYKFAEGGKMIEGTGHLTQGAKPVMNMNSKYGWDPQAKQTYYIDFHGHDTVYSGHITWKNNQFLIDFVGLIGDKGHWITYCDMPTNDRFEFNMFEYKGGKLVPTHLAVKLHRAS